MPHADVNGQRLYYEVHGEGEPLLIVMGLAGDLLAWAPQIPTWSESFRVVAPENRDVGRSSQADGPYEIADMADDTLALADQLELDSFHLLGLSMGGAISQQIALKAPDRLRSLTLCVTWGGNGPYGAARSRLIGEQIKRMSPEEHVDYLMLLTMSEEFYANPDSVAWLRKMIMRNPNPQPTDAFLRQFDACGRHEVRDRLEQIDVPTHVVGAAHDMMVPPWKSTELAHLIPGAQLTMLDRAPHLVNLESAERFNQVVTDFLRAHSGTGQRDSASARTTPS